ncbi:MAG: response regulator [Desulfobacterales bacterium]|nr:response regulator [Desulfobacterales bacterium]
MDHFKQWEIILIDDEEDIREVLSIVLEDAGYSVTTASDGDSGIKLCDDIQPQIIITDIRMPGMDGIQVLEAVKKDYPDIEVIVVTAFGEMELAVKALQLGASDFVTKPIDEDVLMVSIKRAQQRYTSRKKLQDYTRFLEREIKNQASILHQDKMMSLGRLSASVVHEINNPLFGILNYIKLMIKIIGRGQLKEESIQKFGQYLDLVEKETQRCSDIVSNLLTFSRKSEPSFEQLDISDLFKKCILLSQHKLELCNIDLISKIEPDIPAVRGDSNQLQQCLINLIFNSIDAMPNGGTLNLSCVYDSKDNHVLIIVQDTGCGIKDKDIAHIFEPFFTTKEEGYGVGLGLSTVYGIIEHHNGRVNVASKPGNTSFKMYLPIEAK